MIRLVYVLRRKPGMSLADFQQYWRGIHGPLVAKHATTLDILRYVQGHTLEDPVNVQLAGARGAMEQAYDGVAELWWTNREALVSTLRGPFICAPPTWWNRHSQPCGCEPTPPGATRRSPMPRR